MTPRKLQTLINNIKQQEATVQANRSAEVTLSVKDLEELSMIRTRLQLLAMKLDIGHRDSNATAKDDKNYSCRLMSMKQSLTEMHDFYAKEH